MADSGSQAGVVGEVALLCLGRRAITAVRDGGGKLLLISWDLAGGLNSITRLADSGSQAGAASLVALTATRESMFVTACRQGNGSLLLISWRLMQDGTLTRLGDSGILAGDVSAVAIITVGSPFNNSLITAVRTRRGLLKLIVWELSGEGTRFVRRSEGGEDAGQASEIAMALTGDGFLTAVRDSSSGTLRVTAWAFGNGSVGRLGDSGTQAGKASRIAIHGIGGTSHGT